MTQSETIKAAEDMLHTTWVEPSQPFKDALEIIRALIALVQKGGEVVVPVQDCPDCDNVGYTVQQDPRTGDPELCQCKFCYTTPNSRFNVEAMLEVAKEDR